MGRQRAMPARQVVSGLSVVQHVVLLVDNLHLPSKKEEHPVATFALHHQHIARHGDHRLQAGDHVCAAAKLAPHWAYIVGDKLNVGNFQRDSSDVRAIPEHRR